MNYLQLCQETRRQCGISGVCASVRNQNGTSLDIVTYVNTANHEIINEFTRWAFLQDSTQGQTEPGRAVYMPGDFGMVVEAADQERIHKLFVNGLKLKPLEWWEFKTFQRGQGAVPGQPKVYSVAPDGRIAISPAPESILPVEVDYYKVATPLTENTSVSQIPTLHQHVIIYKATMKYATEQEDSDLYIKAERLYEPAMQALTAKYLPKPKFF